MIPYYDSQYPGLVQSSLSSGYQQIQNMGHYNGQGAVNPNGKMYVIKFSFCSRNTDW